MTWGYWVGLALLFFLIEILTGSGFLLVIGIAAAIVAMLPFIFVTMILAAQILIFSILAIVGIIVWKVFIKNKKQLFSDKPFLNNRAGHYIGHVFILQTPIVGRMGRINIFDTIWQIKCDEDLPTGTKIIIDRVDGVVLVVKRVSN